MPLDEECKKALAILQAFTENPAKDRQGNNTKSCIKIPPRVLRKAKGLAIFTAFRTGLSISGAAGSGVLIARKQDGSWGLPSGILLHTLGVGYLVGMDVYDTVLVLRTQAAVDAFAKPRLRVSIGTELSVTAGPKSIVVGAVDMGISDRSPAWAYTKSKGLYAGIQFDGTIIGEREDENERFYGRKITTKELIRGDGKRPMDAAGLMRLLRWLNSIDIKNNAPRR